MSDTLAPVERDRVLVPTKNDVKPRLSPSKDLASLGIITQVVPIVLKFYDHETNRNITLGCAEFWG